MITSPTKGNAGKSLTDKGCTVLLMWFCLKSGLNRGKLAILLKRQSDFIEEYPS